MNTVAKFLIFVFMIPVLAISANAQASPALVGRVLAKLEREYGNRRVMSEMNCRVRANGERSDSCSDAEASAAMPEVEAAAGNYAWKRKLNESTGKYDLTSWNMRFSFRIATLYPDVIVMSYTLAGRDNEWACGLVKSEEVADMQWSDCLPGGSAIEHRWYKTAAGQPLIEAVGECDAARYCSRVRWLLETEAH